MKSWMVKLAIAAGGVLLLIVLVAVWLSRGLPDIAELRSGLPVGYLHKGRSIRVPLQAISPKLRAAVIVSEDVAFYQHRGFDFTELGTAFLENLRAGRYRRGASTITQQVAKNLYLGAEKTLRRKFREAALTMQLERNLPKDRILEIYLNIAEWGEGVAGAEAASRLYFSKSADDLTWSEAALLAGILPDPNRLSPLQAPEQALRRRRMVLLKLLYYRALGPEEFRQADLAPCRDRPNSVTVERAVR